MDAPDVPREELAGALAYLRFVNRRLGGSRALIACLARWSRSWPRDRPVTLVDVGCGSGDIALAAVAWARARGFDLRVTGVDNHAGTVALAREHTKHEPRVEIIEADAATLAERYARGAFDYAHAALFLHHLPDIRVLTVLAAMDRVARRGIVWSDLVRSGFHKAIVMAACVGQGRIVRHDARVSVEAGFTRGEVLDIARRLDLTYARYAHTPLWYRFTLAGEKPSAWAERNAPV
jgi:SAM-dependent methyltransferase